MEGPRPARPDEFDKVMELVNLVFLPDAAPTMQIDYPLVFNPKNTQNLRIIVEDGRPVSNISLKQWPIGVCGCVTKIGSIGSVCTHPDYRGKGFATKILQHCIDDLDVSGGSLMLISGNRGLYQRIHSTRIGKMLTFAITEDVAKKAKRERLQAERFDVAHLADYVRLYQQEPVRFIREPDQWAKMVHVAMKKDGPPVRAIYEVSYRDEIAAYAVLRFPTRPYHKGVARLTEYAGARWALVASLAEIMAQCKLERIDIPVPAYDAEMRVQLMELGVEPVVSTMPGTWKMVNFARCMGTFWRYLEEKLGEETANELYFADDEEKYVIRFKEEQFVPRDGTHLMEILFGAGEECVSLDGAPGELREILNEVSPIPLPMPGMNGV